MADATVSSPAPRKKRSWLRLIVWILGVFIVLLVVAYFIGTSSAFVKGVILPKAGAAMNATITVSDASISPFKQVVLRDLKVQTTGAEPLVTAPEVRLRYSLMDIIRGNILVHEVTVTSPTITLVENPEGASNLDPILKSQEEKPAEPAKPSEPAQVEVKKVTISNGTVRQVKLYAGGKRDLTEVSNLNFELSNLKNGQPGKMTVGADVKMENNPPAPGTNGLLQAKLNGNFDFSLTSDLKPASIQGNTRLAVTRAEGGLAEATGLAVNLDCQVTPTEIKQVALAFQRGETRLGQLLVNGPFDMEKMEGRLNAQLLGIDKNLLNLAGASSGLDFGPTTINSTNQIALAKAGQSVTVAGQFNLNNLQVTRTNQTTPPLDLRANYDLSVDLAASNAVVRAFNLNGTQKANQFLRGELTSPMTIAWGNVSNAIGDSALNVTVTHLDLANWKALLGDVAPAGDVNAKLQLLSKQAGEHLDFDLGSEIVNLTAAAGTNQVTGVNVTLRVRGQAANLEKYNLPEYRLELSRQNQPVMSVSGSGVYDQRAETADLQLEGQVLLARLLQLMPQPDANFSSGTAQLKARVVQKKEAQNIAGNFNLTELTGQFGSNSFRNFGAKADFDIGMTPEQIQVKKLSGNLTEGTNFGGAFDLTAAYNLTNQAAQFNAKLANFNQAGLRAFLEPMLADKKLMTVALSGTASAQYDPQGASAIKADLQVTNLVVKDPKGQFPARPLEARMAVDASLKQQVAEVRQFTLGLTPTARATNQVQLTGRIDMTQSTNIQGNLKLAADSLDVTSYYDLFAGQSTTAEAAPAARPPSAPAPGAPPKPETEPEPIRLPLSNFVADAVIGKFFLHEIAISNLQTTAKINGGAVAIDPFKLNLNGAPVSATVNLDLGVPGYKYDFGANAQAIPLAPVVNSFQPERKGQVGGTLTAQAKISGAGTTGASLQKSLAGQFDVATTNLNLSIVHIRNPLLRALVNVIAVIPELARNPGSALTSLAGAVVTKPGSSGGGGLASELEKSPINQILLKGAVGSGKMQLEQAQVQSAVFQANATGTVQLATVLTNSPIQIPVSLALSRGVAERLKLVPENTPTNQAYVKLPDFLTFRGTVGEPKRDINEVALAGTLFRGVKGILGGSQSGGTNAPSGVGGLLQGLLGGASTNTPPGSATNAPQSPVGGLLDNILRPKKK